MGIDQFLNKLNKGLDPYTITVTQKSNGNDFYIVDTYAESVQDALIKIGEYEKEFRDYREQKTVKQID